MEENMELSNLIIDLTFRSQLAINISAFPMNTFQEYSAQGI